MIYKGLDEDESAFLQFVVDKQIEHEDEVVKNELQEVSAYRVSLLVHTHHLIRCRGYYFFRCSFVCGYYRGRHLFLWEAHRHQRWLDKVHTSDTVMTVRCCQ